METDKTREKKGKEICQFWCPENKIGIWKWEDLVLSDFHGIYLGLVWSWPKIITLFSWPIFLVIKETKFVGPK